MTDISKIISNMLRPDAKPVVVDLSTDTPERRATCLDVIQNEYQVGVRARQTSPSIYVLWISIGSGHHMRSTMGCES